MQGELFIVHKFVDTHLRWVLCTLLQSLSVHVSK